MDLSMCAVRPTHTLRAGEHYSGLRVLRKPFNNVCAPAAHVALPVTTIVRRRHFRS